MLGEMCTLQGYCSFVDGRCQLTSDDDCKKTSACRSVGACTYRADTGHNRMEQVPGCVVGGVNDCKGSQSCRDDKNCIFKAGLCVKNP